LALWAGVVDINSGGDGMLPNDGDIIGSSIAEVIVPVWVLGMVAEVLPVPQQCSAAIKYLNISPVAYVWYYISPSAQMKDQNVGFTRETQNECAVGSCELLSFDIPR